MRRKSFSLVYRPSGVSWRRRLMPGSPAALEGVKASVRRRTQRVRRLPHNFRTSFLIDTLAAPLDQDDQHNHESNSRNDSNQRHVIHLNAPFDWGYVPKDFAKPSNIAIKDGPSATTKSEGKMKKTRGKTSFTVVFAARSSAFWRLCVRMVSENTRKVLAMLVPNVSA